MAIDISSVSSGISFSGMDTYIESLKISLLTDIETLIDNYTEIETAINNGWQGESAKHFLDSFANARQKLKDELKDEYTELTKRLVDLRAMYFKIDQDMMEIDTF